LESFINYYSRSHLLVELRGFIDYEKIELNEIINLLNILSRCRDKIFGLEVQFFLDDFIRELLKLALESDKYKIDKETQNLM
jgi:hypothetical protein